jgi:septal ring factor EnvC (AmiA/AmiB activator)
MRLITSLFVLQVTLPAAAETCKYVDTEGHVTYSNVPIKNAKKLSCFDTPAPTAAPPVAAPNKPSARVNAPTQRKRDDERRRILEEELTSEQSALDEAKKALAEQEEMRVGGEKNYQRVLDRLKPFQETVEQHEKNVAALKQELANLR